MNPQSAAGSPESPGELANWRIGELANWRIGELANWRIRSRYTRALVTHMLRWYRWIACFFLLNAMEAFGVIDRMVYGSWPGKPSDQVTRTITLSMMMAAVVLCARSYNVRRNETLRGLRYAFSISGLLLITCLWSMDPSATIRQSLAYFFVVIGGIGIASGFAVSAFFDILELACLLSAIGSVLLLVVSPGSATMAEAGDYIGIFPHKQFLGQVMAAGVFASLHVLCNGKRGYLRQCAILAFFTIMTLASKSTTSLMMIVLFYSCTVLAWLWKKGGAARFAAVASILICGPVLLFVAVSPDSLFELIGKDPTLTGRTEIWAYVLDDIAVRPMFGWGYFGFWTLSNPASVEISDGLKWVVPQAHNGLLEMLLNIGAVGTVFFVILFMKTVVSAVRCIYTPGRDLGQFTILYCLAIFVLSISEPVLLTATQPSTSIFLITTLMCNAVSRAHGKR